MKILILITGILVSAPTFASNMEWVAMTKKILQNHAAECAVAKINVTQIVKNSHIQGKVSGLKEASLEDFKMIFYVQTQGWYVHPYQYNPAQPSGYSYSDLTTGGNFWIRSVFRTPAKKMLAILVPSTHLIYNRKSNSSDLLKYACASVEIPGNGDFSP